MRPFAWTQPRGEDKLEPTADLVLSPPFSTLNPGDTQTIRVVLRRPASAQEGAYRLLIDQLPSIADPGSVRVALRVSLPVFAAPVGAGRAALTWTLVGSDAVKRTLVVRNTGARHAKLLSLAISGSATAPGFTFRYVLAGSEAVIPVEAGPRGWNTLGGSVHISSSTDEGKVEADATISPAS